MSIKCKYPYPKILLINIPDYDDRRPQEPLGLNYLAAFLRKHGYNIEVLDANFYLKKLSLDQIVAFIRKNKYDVIGMPVYTPVFSTSIEIAKKIKQINPKIKVILGGHHVTFTHQALLEEFPFVDIIVRGEGEETLLELIQRLRDRESLKEVKGISYRDKDKVIVTPPRRLIENLDLLPFPIRQKEYYRTLPRQARTSDLVASRGCPYRCSFCSISYFYNAQSGEKYRMRSRLNVVDEIITLVDRFKIKHISFADDNLLVNPEYLIKITDSLLSKNIFLTFNLSTRADQIIRNENLIPLLRKRGLRTIEVGIESGSQAALNRLCKNVTVEENKEAVGILRKNGIRAKIDFIMFDPQTTVKELRESANLVNALGTFPLLFDDFAESVLFNRLILHPGTLYYKRMHKAGKLKGSIFAPEYEFEDKQVAKIYDLVIYITEKLHSRITPAVKLVAKIIFLIRKATGYLKETRHLTQLNLISQDLAILKFQLNKALLSIIEKILHYADRRSFFRKASLAVEDEIKNELRLLNNRISREIEKAIEVVGLYPAMRNEYNELHKVKAEILIQTH